MIQIDLRYIYNLKEFLGIFRNITAGKNLGEVWLDLSLAEARLRNLYDQSILRSGLRASRLHANQLVIRVNEIFDRNDNYDEVEITNDDALTIRENIDAIEQIIQAELATGFAYYVTPKAGYDTSALLFAADYIWPPSLLPTIPETADDVDALGKCISFELGTAAAFHAFRILEIVLRRYWKAITKDAAPRNGAIGPYLNAMEKREIGDEFVIGSLRQIKDLHRNPMIHPGKNISIDEAIDTVGIVRSAVSAMLKVIPDDSDEKSNDIN